MVVPVSWALRLRSELEPELKKFGSTFDEQIRKLRATHQSAGNPYTEWLLKRAETIEKALQNSGTALTPPTAIPASEEQKDDYDE